MHSASLHIPLCRSAGDQCPALCYSVSERENELNTIPFQQRNIFKEKTFSLDVRPANATRQT
jgi:hypothetical protein